MWKSNNKFCKQGINFYLNVEILSNRQYKFIISRSGKQKNNTHNIFLDLINALPRIPEYVNSLQPS